MKLSQSIPKKVKQKNDVNLFLFYFLASNPFKKEKKKAKLEVDSKLQDFSKIYTGLKNYLDFDFLRWKKLNEKNDNSSLNDNNCCIFFLVLFLFVIIIF